MLNLFNTRKRKLKKDLSPLKKEKESYYRAKVLLLDARDGERLIAVLNPEQAALFGINVHDKIVIKKAGGQEQIVLDVSISSMVKSGEVALYADVLDKLSFED